LKPELYVNWYLHYSLGIESIILINAADLDSDKLYLKKSVYSALDDTPINYTY